MSDEDRQRMEEDEEEEQEVEAEEEADEDEIGTLELYWKSKPRLMNLFWEVRISLVQRGISASYIVKVGSYAGMDSNRTVKPKEVFEKLVEFEQELKSIKGKNKRKTDGEGTGLIPDVQGNTGCPHNDKGIEFDRDYSQLSLNRFRLVNGLSDEELKQVWTLLESGDVWVAKPAKYQGSEAVVSLKDYCKKLKAICSLGKHVVKFWPSRYREVYDKWSDLEKAYNFPDKWLESMFKYIPEKADKEVAADEASSSDVETDDGNTRRRKKGKKKSFVADPLPSQIASAIHRVYCAKRGESAPKRLEPLEVLHIKDITKYQLTLDEKLECPLVFLDLTHPHMHAWEKPEFSSFLGIVRDLIVSKCFAVVAIMDFGQAPVDFAHALKDMKDARVIVDYGCYEVKRVHNRTDLPYPCWQLIYAFVSLVAEDYTPVLITRRSPSQQPFLLETQPSKWREEMNVDQGDHAESINGRDVVYFANSSFESEFITKYSKALCKFSKRISDWFVQFGQGKKLAASTPVAATVGDYHASSSDVNVASVVVDDQITSDAWQRLGMAQRRVVDYEPDDEDDS
ncbi:hypothetical protein R1sor_004954 [Riccia sorocarpa]|uniref:Uncharacterized protein n=1 Tax=Riccia sorocarpa TaxID=122646 RepID=A0ABD3HIQ9_9MARC